MIKTIKITNHLGEIIDLPLKNPETSGFFIWSVEGLGPSKANINMTDVLSIDGGVYNSARAGARNIILSLGMVEKPTIEDIRQKSYKYFPVKKPITITVETDNRVCFATGYVESNEPDIFSPRESTVISVLCPNPYFYSLEKQITLFSGIEPAFKFPFSNESLSVSLIKFGEILINTEQSVYYDGDADIGIIMYIHLLGAVTNLTIYSLGTRQSMHLDTTKLEAIIGGPLINGDDIIISSVKGNKYIQHLRNGVYKNILNALDRNTDWFEISKGDNLFSYTADTGLTNLQFRIENETAYEGI